VPLHYAPLVFELPRADLHSLALVGQVMFAAAGLEYIAIMAGETHAAATGIGRSVILATPIILAMFVLGTASVVCFHERNPAIRIDFVAPIPQTLTLAFGGGLAAVVAKLAILLLQVRIIGVASNLFAGAVRLPMAAGWDHLIPEWFTRLHPRHRTPVNAILVSGIVVAALLILGSAGVRAVEAFSVLNDASNEFYALAYLAMFLIPICGAAPVRAAVPRWVAAICGAGVLAILFVCVINAYPFVDVASPGLFAAKILGTTALVNVVGLSFYALRSGNESLSLASTLERS
jgi:amino acid transporter